MTCQLWIICSILFIVNFNNAYKTCFEESNQINYIFLNNMSQIKLPLIPLNCFYCQTAYQVSAYKTENKYNQMTYPG
jgi:hypothetical protein